MLSIKQGSLIEYKGTHIQYIIERISNTKDLNTYLACRIKRATHVDYKGTY